MMMTSFATTGADCRPISPVVEIGQDGLIVIQLQVHDALLPKPARRPGLGVERDQPVARRDIEDACFLAVGPVGEAAAGELARSGRAARALALAVHPEQLAGSGIQRDGRAARSGGGV